MNCQWQEASAPSKVWAPPAEWGCHGDFPGSPGSHGLPCDLCVLEDLGVARHSRALRELTVLLATVDVLHPCFPDALPSWDMSPAALECRGFLLAPRAGSKGPSQGPRIHRGEKHQIWLVAGCRATLWAVGSLPPSPQDAVPLLIWAAPT